MTITQSRRNPNLNNDCSNVVKAEISATTLQKKSWSFKHFTFFLGWFANIACITLSEMAFLKWSKEAGASQALRRISHQACCRVLASTAQAEGQTASERAVLFASGIAVILPWTRCQRPRLWGAGEWPCVFVLALPRMPLRPNLFPTRLFKFQYAL